MVFPLNPQQQPDPGAGLQLPANLQNLFQQQTPANAAVTKGSLVAFNYLYWVHDPYPLIMVTDIHPGIGIRGINLHYLTLTYFRNLITQNSHNPNFSYQNIKGDRYISNAFRSYKWAGVNQLRKFDSEFLLKVMSVSRSIDPYQIKAIRQSIQEQIRKQVNPPAPTQPTVQGQGTPEI